MSVYYDLGAIKLYLEGRQLVLTLFASIQVYFLHFWRDLKTVLVHSFVIKNISFSRLCCYSMIQSTLLNILKLLNQIHHLLHIESVCNINVNSTSALSLKIQNLLSGISSFLNLFFEDSAFQRFTSRYQF